MILVVYIPHMMCRLYEEGLTFMVHFNQVLSWIQVLPPAGARDDTAIGKGANKGRQCHNEYVSDCKDVLQCDINPLSNSSDESDLHCDKTRSSRVNGESCMVLCDNKTSNDSNESGQVLCDNKTSSESSNNEREPQCDDNTLKALCDHNTSSDSSECDQVLCDIKTSSDSNESSQELCDIKTSSDSNKSSQELCDIKTSSDSSESDQELCDIKTSSDSSESGHVLCDINTSSDSRDSDNVLCDNKESRDSSDSDQVVCDKKTSSDSNESVQVLCDKKTSSDSSDSDQGLYDNKTSSDSSDSDQVLCDNKTASDSNESGQVLCDKKTSSDSSDSDQGLCDNKTSSDSSDSDQVLCDNKTSSDWNESGQVLCDKKTSSDSNESGQVLCDKKTSSDSSDSDQGLCDNKTSSDSSDSDQVLCDNKTSSDWNESGQVLCDKKTSSDSSESDQVLCDKKTSSNDSDSEQVLSDNKSSGDSSERDQVLCDNNDFSDNSNGRVPQCDDNPLKGCTDKCPRLCGNDDVPGWNDTRQQQHELEIITRGQDLDSNNMTSAEGSSAQHYGVDLKTYIKVDKCTGEYLPLSDCTAINPAYISSSVPLQGDDSNDTFCEEGEDVKIKENETYLGETSQDISQKFNSPYKQNNARPYESAWSPPYETTLTCEKSDGNRPRNGLVLHSGALKRLKDLSPQMETVVNKFWGDLYENTSLHACNDNNIFEEGCISSNIPDDSCEGNVSLGLEEGRSEADVLCAELTQVHFSSETTGHERHMENYHVDTINKSKLCQNNPSHVQTSDDNGSPKDMPIVECGQLSCINGFVICTKIESNDLVHRSLGDPGVSCESAPYCAAHGAGSTAIDAGSMQVGSNRLAGEIISSPDSAGAGHSECCCADSHRTSAPKHDAAQLTSGSVAGDFMGLKCHKSAIPAVAENPNNFWLSASGVKGGLGTLEATGKAPQQVPVSATADLLQSYREVAAVPPTSRDIVIKDLSSPANKITDIPDIHRSIHHNECACCSHVRGYAIRRDTSLQSTEKASIISLHTQETDYDDLRGTGGSGATTACPASDAHSAAVVLHQLLVHNFDPGPQEDEDNLISCLRSHSLNNLNGRINASLCSSLLQSYIDDIGLSPIFADDLTYLCRSISDYSNISPRLYSETLRIGAGDNFAISPEHERGGVRVLFDRIAPLGLESCQNRLAITSQQEHNKDSVSYIIDCSPSYENLEGDIAMYTDRRRRMGTFRTLTEESLSSMDPDDVEATKAVTFQESRSATESDSIPLGRSGKPESHGDNTDGSVLADMSGAGTSLPQECTGRSTELAFADTVNNAGQSHVGVPFSGDLGLRDGDSMTGFCNDSVMKDGATSVPGVARDRESDCDKTMAGVHTVHSGSPGSCDNRVSNPVPIPEGRRDQEEYEIDMGPLESEISNTAPVNLYTSGPVLDMCRGKTGNFRDAGAPCGERAWQDVGSAGNGATRDLEVSGAPHTQDINQAEANPSNPLSGHPDQKWVRVPSPDRVTEEDQEPVPGMRRLRSHSAGSANHVRALFKRRPSDLNIPVNITNGWCDIKIEVSSEDQKRLATPDSGDIHDLDSPIMFYGELREQEDGGHQPTTCVKSPSPTSFSVGSESDSERKLNALSKPTDIDDVLFDLLADKDERVPVAKFWNAIKSTGLRHSDPRLKECKLRFEEVQRQAGASGEGWDFTLDRDTFKECISENIFLIGKAFKNDLVIPEFYTFIHQIELIYHKCRDNTKGKPADYIPQLARVNPSQWGISICTIDGQRHSFGETQVPFCLQSCSKPLNYALAISDMGQERVHQYIGQEPSGRSFNELTLDTGNKPHNPMINAGAIVTTSLLKNKSHIADRFDYIFNQYKRLAGGEYIGFSNSTYLSERESADRNFALGYYMRENQCFPDHTDLIQTLELYFQLCSVEVTADSASVIAATLANGGICPISGERVLAGDAVRNTLSLMYSCGMYDYSGQFAFKVGLPAKSGVAGAILLVVPNVMGICTWGPPLDTMGNSCRGVQFCEELVRHFNFHNYDDLNHTEKKLDPRKSKVDNEANSVVNLLFGAANGDVTAIRRFALSGMDMTASDYDGRTALHLAAAEGHLPVVRMLLEQCKVHPKPKDRWDFTPLDDAVRFKHDDCAKYLEDYIQRLSSGSATPQSPKQSPRSQSPSAKPAQKDSPAMYSTSPNLPKKASPLTHQNLPNLSVMKITEAPKT